MSKRPHSPQKTKEILKDEKCKAKKFQLILIASLLRYIPERLREEPHDAQTFEELGKVMTTFLLRSPLSLFKFLVLR
jgi:hypothetical protein